MAASSPALSLTVRQLRAKLHSLGLETTGKKAELVARLEASAGFTQLPQDQNASNPAVAASNATATVDTSDREREDRGVSAELRSTILSVMTDTLPILLAAQSAASPPVAPHIADRPANQTSQMGTRAIPPSAPLQPASRLLPSNNLSRSATDKILAGEFVEFSTLLPDASVGNSGGHQGGRHILQLELQDGLPLRVVEDTPQQPRARHVHDIATWLEAYSVFMHTILQVAPHRALELINYQSLILEANRRFLPAGWMAYDRSFRQAAARDASLRWDCIEGNVWQLSVTGHARPQCTSCNQTHPPTPSGRCPFRPFRSGNPDGPYTARPICRNYNANRCSGGCGRSHICTECRGPHPATVCSSASQSSSTTPAGSKPGKPRN